MICNNSPLHFEEQSGYNVLRVLYFTGKKKLPVKLIFINFHRIQSFSATPDARFYYFSIICKHGISDNMYFLRGQSETKQFPMCLLDLEGLAEFSDTSSYRKVRGI